MNKALEAQLLKLMRARVGRALREVLREYEDMIVMLYDKKQHYNVSLKGRQVHIEPWDESSKGKRYKVNLPELTLEPVTPRRRRPNRGKTRRAGA